MARAVRNWLIVAAAGLALVALSFLLLGEGAVDRTGSFLFDGNGRRESTLEARVRRAHDDLYRLQLRDSLFSILGARVSGVEAILWIDPELQPELDALLPDGAVADLEGAVASFSARPPRFSVMVALTVDSVPPREGVPWTNRDEVIYFLPAATGGTACLAVFSHKNERAPFRLWSPVFAGTGAPDERVSALLGPCAYYAAFGQPRYGVESWLGATRFEPARLPLSLAGFETELEFSRPDHLINLARAWRPGRELVACAAGNAGACRTGVLAAGPLGYGPDSHGGSALSRGIIVRSSYFSFSPLGPNANRWLSDVLADVGPRRFAALWSSPAPVDSAFAAATGASLERWTMGWARAQLGEPRSGPAVPLSASVVALIISGGLGVDALTWVQRRQVR